MSHNDSHSRSTTFARLPSNITPSHYDLNYTHFDFHRFHFYAHEAIQLKVHADSTDITCHAVDLSILSVNVVQHVKEDDKTNMHQEASWTKRRITCLSWRICTRQQTITFYLNEMICAGSTLTLELHFIGHLNDELRGLYRSAFPTFEASNEKTEWMSTLR